MNIKVSIVLSDSPPITVMAKGAPMAPTYSDCPSARGNMATMVVMAVIRIGRTLESPASINARDFRCPLLRRILVKSIRMIPLLTTTPRRIRNPVRVLALKRLLLVNISARKDPMAARGTEKITTKGVTSDSNTDARIMIIRTNAAAIRK